MTLPDCLDHGVGLAVDGRLSEAIAFYRRSLLEHPGSVSILLNLANVLQAEGSFAESNAIYLNLLESTKKPLAWRVASNYLAGLQYQGDFPDVKLKEITAVLGEQFGCEDIRPTKPASGLPLRIGFIGADLCDHPVGFFLLPFLRCLDRRRFLPLLFSTGGRDDATARALKAVAAWHDVADLDMEGLLAHLRHEALDILVDLSGHTAGNRLPVFARRAAPLQISWLGYFASTGILAIDAVLMDDWHVPLGGESQFTEAVIRLPGGRFCYTPVPFAPAVSPAPTFTKGHVTFGSFNNTAKYHPQVFDLWAAILQQVPASRLILKWRTFNDAAFRQQVTAAFVQRGIQPDRIELRAPSFHVDLLKEYADIDIALDPFPFTGGLTSCEALWMGVPVITWPQSRVVSRQTFAFLNQIGLSELAARDADDYVRIAVRLAQDKDRLLNLRSSLRQRMQASPLCDVDGFTKSLEDTLLNLYRRIESAPDTTLMIPKTILHVGPGHRQNGARLPAAFASPDWQEIRLDIDPVNEPDIVGSMLDMAAVQNESVDAIYSAHNIEHVYAHEVPLVLKEFLRVLKPDGFLVVTCPDLQTVCQLVAEDKLTDPAYTAQAGAITPLDILYGHGQALAEGHHYMAHKCGFTLRTLTQALHTAGFATSAGKRRARGLDLWVVATKGPMEEGVLRELAGKVLPG